MERQMIIDQSCKRATQQTKTTKQEQNDRNGNSEKEKKKEDVD
jgi:hypothetical protein